MTRALLLLIVFSSLTGCAPLLAVGGIMGVDYGVHRHLHYCDTHRTDTFCWKK